MSKRSIKCWPQRVLLGVCCFGLLSAASANLTFNGTLNEPPPCTIDSGSTIEVDFGDVGTKRVDGVKYRRAVGYTIRCGASTLPWLLKLSVKGTETSFDNAALQTTAPDLGIRLYQNSLPFRLNTPLDISLSAPPTLEVVPVKRPGSVLKAQGFTAVATLLAEYQ